MRRLDHLVDGDRALGHPDAPLAEEGEHRVARHAGQDRARSLERRRQDLVADPHHDVHRAHFVDVLLAARRPSHSTWVKPDAWASSAASRLAA